MVRARTRGPRDGRFDFGLGATTVSSVTESSRDSEERSVPLGKSESVFRVFWEPLTVFVSASGENNAAAGSVAVIVGVFDRGASFGEVLNRLGYIFSALSTRRLTSPSNVACR